MKKKFIIPIIIGAVLLVLIAVLLVILLFANRNPYASVVTMDINPSIEFQLDNKDKIINVTAINDDAKEIIDEDFVGMDFEKMLKPLAENLIDKGYTSDNEINILLYANGKIDVREIEGELFETFKEKDIKAYIDVVEKVSKEDEELAKKYNISPAKAYYINVLANKYEEVKVEDLIDTPVHELGEMESSGNYCDEGYSLERGSCFKEIERVPAKEGNICTDGYYEYNGVCYKEVGAIEGAKLECGENETLEGDTCISNNEYEPQVKCSDTTDHIEGNLCVERKVVGEAYEFCRDPGRTLYDHKCLATKPSINGGCLGSDKYYNGKCLNLIDDYYMAEWKCSNGQVISNHDGSLQNNDTKCYEEVRTTGTYYCEGIGTLTGNKCISTNKRKAGKESLCPTGYTKVNDGRCINMNDTANKTPGYYCDRENSRLNDKTCVIYDIVEPKQYK